jgi:hypothetical protein
MLAAVSTPLGVCLGFRAGMDRWGSVRDAHGGKGGNAGVVLVQLTEGQRGQQLLLEHVVLAQLVSRQFTISVESNRFQLVQSKPLGSMAENHIL